MTRTTTLVLVAGLCGSGIGCADDTKPDFSGTWVLDLGRSSLEIPAPDSSILVIEHAEPSLRATRTHALGEAVDTSRTELTTDSALTVVRAGSLEIPTRVYWDEEALVLDQTWSVGDVTVTNLVRYTMARDGRTLIADERMKAGSDEHHNVWTFRRR